MINPQPEFERPRGVRGTPTETYVRSVQERAARGADPTTADGREPAGSAREPAGGVLGFLQKLWPFGRRS